MWPGPYGEWGSKKYLISSLDQSLQRMGLDYVDIFYSHRPDPDTPLEEVRKHWRQLVRDSHPDRMLARGVPQEAVKLAEKRMVDINRAWEEINGGVADADRNL